MVAAGDHTRDGSMLNGTVVVTGGTGFIGGRVVERLALETSANVRVLVRSFSTASRIARFPVEIVKTDLSDPDEVSRAVAGSEIVIHTALDAAELGSNVVAAANLGEACLEHGVSRLVHLSTFSVYEPFPIGDLDEDSERVPCGSPYADTKLEIEKLLKALHVDRGLPVAMLQPTIVYGPFAGTWTIDPVFRLRRGRVVLPDGGEGLCNAVYVDDVVSAAFCAAVRREAVGNHYLVSYSEPVTWREFFEAYEEILDIQSLDFVSADEIERSIESVGPVAAVRRLVRDPHRILDYEWAKILYWNVKKLVGDERWSKVREGIPPHVTIPEDTGRLDLLRSETAVRVEKARRELGWEPQFDLSRGMQLTGEYIRWARL